MEKFNKIFMKVILILFFWVIGIVSIFAQHSLRSNYNMFRAGDEIIKQQVEYKDPGRSGEHVLWDFSQLKVINDEYELIYSTYNDTVITGVEHLTFYHYVLQNDSLLLLGFDNQATKLHNVQPELLLKFPMNYGNRVQSNFYAHGKHGNRLELDAMGTTETVADSYGMMILPSKDTLKNMLRTRTVKYIAEDTRPISDIYYEKLKLPLQISPDSVSQRLTADSVVFVVETFRWYEKGYRYPIFETVRSWEQHRNDEEHEFLATAFFYPPQDHYYLENDEDNLAVRVGVANPSEESTNPENIDPWHGLTYNFYPNPVATNLEIEVYMPKQGQVRMQLTDRLGRLVWENNYGKWEEGIHTSQIFMSPFVKGEYVLNMWFDEYMVGEKIMKK